MAYTQVQFIAHNIWTGPKTSVDGTTQEYVGLARADDDIRERVALVGSAITAAYSHAKTVQTAETLKVFMLPEFFFRGKTGAYSMDDVQKVVLGLQTLVKDAKWKDWLFVFGTIIGQSQQTQGASFWSSMMKVLFGASTTAIDQSKPVEVYNYSLVQKGGFGDVKDAPSKAHAVLKEHRSGIDFIKSRESTGGGLVLERVQHLDPSNKTTSESQVHSYDGLSVFQLEGRTFGLEVCLDHLKGRLKTAQQAATSKSPFPAIDIQLVPSCGAYIKASAIVAKKGGYVFNSDGLNSVVSDLQRVDTGTGVAAPVASVAQVNVVYAQVNDIFPKGAGKLTVYPARAL
jgi:hypothetical protein